MNPFRLACLSASIAALTFAVQGAVVATERPSVASLTIRADWFDRGNVRISLPGQLYADRFACIWNAGAQPNQSEYDIEFPVTADFTFVALYAAAASRPIDIYVDDRKVHTGFAAVTGSWQTSSAKWETQFTLSIAKGKHTIKLLCPGPCMPHVCAIRLNSTVPFPDGWKLDRPAARRKVPSVLPPLSPGHQIPELPLLTELDEGLHVEVIEADQYDKVDAESTNELLMEHQPAVAGVLRTPWVAKLSFTAPDGTVQQEALNLSPPRLREMLDRTLAMLDDFETLENVDQSFGQSQRRRCEGILAQLNGLTEQPDSREKWERFCQLYVEGSRLQRRVAFANPLLDFDRLLLVKRSVSSPQLGLPQNWQSNCVLPTTGFDDEIDVSIARGHDRTADHFLPARRLTFCRRPGPALRCRQTAVLFDRRTGQVARLRDQRRRHRPASGDTLVARRAQLRCLLSARRRYHLLVDSFHGRGAVRQRQYARGQLLSHGPGRHHSSTVLRPGTQLVSHRAGKRTRDVSCAGSTPTRPIATTACCSA